MTSAEMEKFDKSRIWERVAPTGGQSLEQSINATAFSWCHALQVAYGESPAWVEVAEEIRRRLDGGA